MSRTASRFHTDILTVWPVVISDDGYNTVSTGTPFSVRCNYDQNNRTVVDGDGTEFIPKFTFYVTATTGQIKRGMRVLIGDHTSSSSTPEGAEIVRQVSETKVQRGLGSPDIVVYV